MAKVGKTPLLARAARGVGRMVGGVAMPTLGLGYRAVSSAARFGIRQIGNAPAIATSVYGAMQAPGSWTRAGLRLGQDLSNKLFTAGGPRNLYNLGTGIQGTPALKRLALGGALVSSIAGAGSAMGAPIRKPENAIPTSLLSDFSEEARGGTDNMGATGALTLALHKNRHG